MTEQSKQDRKLAKYRAKDEKKAARAQAERDAYMQKVQRACDPHLRDDETALEACPANRGGINVDRLNLLSTALTAASNRRREAEHSERAQQLGFPDGRLMVLVCTNRRLLVFEQSPASSRDASWPGPRQYLGEYPLTSLVQVAVQLPNQIQRQSGTLVFVHASGAQHPVTIWNGYAAARFTEAANVAIARAHSA